MSEVKSYQYFDTPDGQDIFEKLVCVLKPTSLYAIGVSIADVMLFSHPKGYLPILGRMGYVATPFFGASTAFVCVTNTVASIRKKDDKLNWFIGGFAAGSVIGVWRRKTILGFNMGMFMGLLAVAKKSAVDSGFTMMPFDQPIATRGIWDYDWTLTAERPRNWTTGKE